MATASRSYKSKGKGKDAPVPKIKVEDLPRLPYDRAVEAHKFAIDRGAQCTKCQLFGLRAGPVMDIVVPNARLNIILEAPGQSEIDTGIPANGKSGVVVDESVVEGGLIREECTIANTCLCRPPEDFKAYELRMRINHEIACTRAREQGLEEPDAPMTPAECCFPRLQKTINESNSKVVLALGGPALRAVAKHWNVPFGPAKKVRYGEIRIASLKKQFGSPVTMPDGTIVVASFHPAFAMRAGSRQYMHVIKKFITRAAEISVRGHIDWVEPPFILNPDVAQIEETLGIMYRAGVHVTVDIETDKGTRTDGEFDPFSCRMRCIGFGAVIDEKEILICVPLRHIDGTQWWNAEDKKRVLQACMNVLNSNPLVGHNLAFDTSVLLRYGMISHENRTKSFFDCHVDSETEFLTETGWKKFDDVTDSDKLGTVDAKGVLAYQNFYRRVEKAFSGTAYVVETMHTRCVVTGNHRMWSQPLWRSNQRTDSWNFRPLEDALVGSPDSCFVRCSAELDVDFSHSVTIDGIEVSEDLLRLIGLVISDGSISYSPKYECARAISVSQKDGGRAHELLETLRDKFSMSRYSTLRDDEWRTKPCLENTYSMCGTSFASTIMSWIGRLSRDKHLPYFSLSLPTNLRGALLEGLMAGDGSKPKAAELYRTTSRRLVDDVQALALSLGVPTTIHIDGECWAASMRPDLPSTDKLVTRIGGKRAYGKITPTEFVKDRIVCFSVPNETLVTRSRNKPAFHGNTMVGHHDTIDNDLPHDLGFVAARYFEVPSWKGAGDDKYYERLTDADLHLYNCKDIVTTMRLHLVIMDEIHRYGTTSQFELDTLLAPIFRDMGELGLIIDEVRRGELSVQMGKEARARLDKLQKLVADPKFNPNSPHQVRDFLFKKKKLIPCINTKGNDWEDGEDPATNVGALTKLVLRQAPDQESRDFINTLLEYRAYMKLKGTYIDKLRVTYEDWSKYGLDIPTVPEVLGQVWVKLNKTERIKIMQERYPSEFTALPQVPKKIPKDVRRQLTQERKAKLDALLTRIEDGYWDDVVVLPVRPALSRLHTTWKIHVTPTGRVSARPAIQNYPERGKANMREMIIAPPGHVIVGADLDQVELRLYAVIAGDKLLLEAFEKGYDPHSYNAASLFTKRFSTEWKRKTSIMEVYEYIIGLPKMYGREYADKECERRSYPKFVDEQTSLLVRLFDDDLKTAQVIERSGLDAWLVEAFAHGYAKGAKEKKKLRNYAKTFVYLECLAKGSLVLTDDGLIPIENVTTKQRVWDGIEWVTHSGVISRGVREVIEYDGVKATPEHKVWLEDGRKVELQDAAALGARLARTGAGRHEIYFVGDHIESLARKRTSQGRSSMHWMWRDSCAVSRQPSRRQVTRMQFVFDASRGASSRVQNGKLRKLRSGTESLRELNRTLLQVSTSDRVRSSMAICPGENYSEQVHEPSRQELEGLWRARHRVSFFRSSQRRKMDKRQSRDSPRLADRQNRQQWTLRAWKFAHDHRGEQLQESTMLESQGGLGVQGRGVALRGIRCARPTRQRTNARRNSRSSAKNSVYAYRKMASSREEIEVFDILNAGSRRRFTANNRLVSNCYGGDNATLFSFMSTVRDKATGTLMFPELQESDVLEWHTEWHRTHPETKLWQELCTRIARIEGYTCAPIGSYRKRFYPGGANKNGATFNTVCQGSAAEIANAAIVKISKAIPYQCWSPFTGLILQIHDYIGVCVPKEYAEQAKQIIEDAMNTVVFGIPITAKAKISQKWSEQ